MAHIHIEKELHQPSRAAFTAALGGPTQRLASALAPQKEHAMPQRSHKTTALSCHWALMLVSIGNWGSGFMVTYVRKHRCRLWFNERVSGSLPAVQAGYGCSSILCSKNGHGKPVHFP